MYMKKKLLQAYEYMHHLVSRFSIMVLLIVQICIINNILAYYKGSDKWWSLLITDGIYFVFFLIHVSSTYRILVLNYKSCNDQPKVRFPWGPLAWVVYSVVLCSKVIVIFTSFAPQMEDGTIVGPNTLRAMIGVTAVIFFLLLMSHMYKDINPSLRMFIYSIGATVPIDLLDTMDIMELLYDAEEKRMITDSMLHMILFIIVVNLLIPVFPLSVLHIPDIQNKHMFTQLMITQKVIQIVVINFLFMTVRLILWQHFGKGFSTFIVKNVLMIAILTYDIFGICKEEHESRKEKEPKIAFEKGEVYI